MLQHLSLRRDHARRAGVGCAQQRTGRLHRPELRQRQKLSLQQLWVGIQIGDCEQPLGSASNGFRQRCPIAELVANRDGWLEASTRPEA